MSPSIGAEIAITDGKSETVDNPLVPQEERLRLLLDQAFHRLRNRHATATLLDLEKTRAAWLRAKVILSDGRFRVARPLGEILDHRMRGGGDDPGE
jgi:hypothetical protein